MKQKKTEKSLVQAREDSFTAQAEDPTVLLNRLVQAIGSSTKNPSPDTYRHLYGVLYFLIEKETGLSFEQEKKKYPKLNKNDIIRLHPELWSKINSSFNKELKKKK